MPIETRVVSGSRSSLSPTVETNTSTTNVNALRDEANSTFEVRPDALSYADILLLVPEIGRIVYDTTNETERYYDGSSWQSMSGSSSSVGQRAANYSSLTNGSVNGELAYCNQAEGTQWLPGTIGGSYYPAGWYLWNGTIWTSDRNNIVNQLQLNVDGLGGKSNVGHTHVKANITDFSDSDYASEEQGVLADAAIQPNDNISELINDSQYVNLADLGIDGLEDYYDQLIYVGGLLTTIETYEDNTKAVNLFTKSFTYTGGALTQISLLNISTSVTETKTLSYDVSGNLINITKS